MTQRAGASNNIMLPWPPKELSPNARLNHFAKARITKAYREQAYYETQSAAWDWSLLRACDGDSSISLRIDFHPPDARKRDLDNMLSSIKSGLDGIADALEVNDQRFSLHISRKPPVKGGLVVVRVEG